MNNIQYPLGLTLVVWKINLDIISKCTPSAHAQLIKIKIWETNVNLPLNQKFPIMQVSHPLVP
jgi:hypothetical protein